MSAQKKDDVMKIGRLEVSAGSVSGIALAVFVGGPDGYLISIALIKVHVSVRWLPVGDTAG